MPSTYLSLHYHIVFSTKNREPLMAPSWRPRLHQYLGGTIRAFDGIPDEIGGVADHVHLLVGLKATHCVADFMRDVKKRTSTWVHEELKLPQFAWQEGYAAFTVSAPACEDVRKYIRNQEHRHSSLSFRDELIEFLERAGVQYDPRYLD